jgi:dihydroorotase-like cyclic amidohydrolase
LEWEIGEDVFAGSVRNSPLLGKKAKGKIVHTVLTLGTLQCNDGEKISAFK